MNQPAIYRFRIVDFPDHEDSVTGFHFSFLANLTDIATLPNLPWTTIFVDSPEEAGEPLAWRMNATDQSTFVELETISDAGMSTMLDEARKAWQNLIATTFKNARYMSLLGAHREVIDRVQEPIKKRRVKVYTLQNDFLAKMYAIGSADIVRIAGVLSRKDSEDDADHFIGAIKLEHFLWGLNETRLEEWQQQRYDKAIAGDYSLFASKYKPQE
jgi:hypothetical protein